MDVRGFIRHFKIPDGAVSLSEKDHRYQRNQGGVEANTLLGDICHLTPFHTGKPCLCQGRKMVIEPRCWCPSPALPLAPRGPSVKQEKEEDLST